MNSHREVVITGLGPVTSIGVGNESFWEALTAGKSNVARCVLPVDLGKMVELPIATIPQDAPPAGVDRHLQFLQAQGATGYRDLAYALLAMELAIADAGLEYEREDNRVGMIQAFEAPGAERTVGQLFGMMATLPPGDGPPPVYDALAPFFYAMQPFGYVHLAAKAFGLHGFSTSVHNACASGAFAIELAAHRVRTGQADAMMVMGGEAFDTAVRLEWFRRLDLYAQDETIRPFDREAKGFFVGEGAGAIVLESKEQAVKRGATIYAEYLGGAFVQQSWKQVIPDVRAARLRGVITDAFSVANVTPADVDLIVPHGAGTQLSDGYEAACLGEALSQQHEHAVATAFKPYVGHMLAASGIIETVAALLAMKHQSVPATLHTDPERVRLPVPLATELLHRPVRTLLKLSTGFTGHDAAAIYRLPE